MCKRKGKKLWNKQQWKLGDSLRFTTKTRSTFWRPGQDDKGDYVQPVTDGELSRKAKQSSL